MDRRAVVMRFYEKRSHGAIGAVLGLSEDATRKRLDRALDRLRALLAKRGIATTSAALATVLPAHAISPAPAGLASSISSTALSTATLATVQTSTLIAFMTHKATITGAALLLLAGVTAVTVPKLAGTKAAASQSMPLSPSESSTASSTGSSSALPRAKASKTNPDTGRLTTKYGDSRTKLSAHLHSEFVALMDDVAAVMNLAHKMDLGDEMADDPEAIFGEYTKQLALSDEQKQKFGTLQAEALKREVQKMQGTIADLKKEPAKFMEYLLAQDAVTRGDLSRAEYDEIFASLDLPEEELTFSLEDNNEEDLLDDAIFVDELVKVLDEQQAELVRKIVAEHKVEEPAKAPEPASLEHVEKQISAGRKMIGGALQLMEGITDGGLAPSK